MNWIKDNKLNLFYSVFLLAIVFCSYVLNSSTELYTKKMSEAVFIILLPVLVLSIMNFFLGFETSKKITNISKLYLIVSFVLILLSPMSADGLDFFSITKEKISIFLASIYSLVSLVIVLYKSLKKN